MAGRAWGRTPDPTPPTDPGDGSGKGQPWAGDTSHATPQVAQQIQRYANRPTELRPERTVEEIYQQLGPKRFREIMTRNGRAPATSTINRWRRNDRIPARAADIAQHVRRADRIDRMGGTRTVAARFGLSQRSVQRYIAGDTQHFSSAAARADLRRSTHADLAADVRLNPLAQPTILVVGNLSIVIDSQGKDYEIAHRSITMDASNTRMSDEQNEALFDAYLNQDYDQLHIQIEAILTTAYFGENAPDTFGSYSPGNRVRIDSLERVTLTWPTLPTP